MRVFYCERCGSYCEESDDGRVLGCEHYSTKYEVYGTGATPTDNAPREDDSLRMKGELKNRNTSYPAMGKRLSDDPGLDEMKRMEYLMSKAPCLARLKELADWSEKKD